MASEDAQLLADKIDRLCDAIDALVGSNVELIDSVVQRLAESEEAGDDEPAGKVVYLDDPAPSDSQGSNDA